MIVIAIAGVFLAGAVTGAVVLLRVGIGREESDYSLRDDPPTRAAKATRRLTGLYVRMPEEATPCR